MDIKRYSVLTWVVFGASCLVPFLDYAMALTFGSLFVHLLDRYGETRATTASVQAILLGLSSVASVITGVLIKKFGVTRVSFLGSTLLSGGFIFSFFADSIMLLDVLIGGVAGLGLSFIYVSSTVVARNNFEGTTRDMAVNANIICVGLGLLLYPYVFDRLTSTYTVNEVFLLLGGVYLNNIAVVILFLIHERETKRQSKSLSGNEEDANNCTENSNSVKSTLFRRIHRSLTNTWKDTLSLMRTRYTFVMLGTAIAISSNQGYLIVFHDIYAWKGFTKDESLILFITFNVPNAISRVLPSIVKKVKPYSNMMLLLTMCAFSGFVGQLCILFTSPIKFAMVGNILSGISQGGIFSAATVEVSNLATTETFSVAIGLLFTLIGIFDFVIGVILGYIRDSVQSYELALILTAVMNGVGACLYIAAPLYGCCRSEKIVNLSEETYKTQSGPVKPLAVISTGQQTLVNE